MASKYCSRCKRIVSTNGVPKFCVWGCGSLEDAPVLKEFKTVEELNEIIKEEEQRTRNSEKAEAKPKQLNLFYGVG